VAGLHPEVAVVRSKVNGDHRVTRVDRTVGSVWHGEQMASKSRHISMPIERPAGDVYDYASNPANLPAWAAGLGGSVERVGGQWFADSPMGRVSIAFAPANEFGILDHRVTLPSGQIVDNPLRVIPDGAGCEVVFTVRRQPGMTDPEFDRDCDAVRADLGTLKQVLESG
jgi:hypothetical protein